MDPVPMHDGGVVHQEGIESAESLLHEGWTVGSTPWAARLRLPDTVDLSLYTSTVHTAEERDYRIHQLTAADLHSIARLDAITASDFPSAGGFYYTPLNSEEPSMSRSSLTSIIE